MRLFLLASNGVVVFDASGGAPRYRYAGGGSDEELMSELAEFYANRPAAVYDIVGTPTRDPLRSFADAFKLKK